MKSKVRPSENIARMARRSMGVVSSMFSWKNFIDRPSWPGVLPLGREVMVFITSSKVSSCPL